MLPVEQKLNVMLACVEHLKQLDPSGRSWVARRLVEEFGEQVSEQSNGKASDIRQVVESEDFQGLNTAQDQYLAILRHLSEIDARRFAEVAPTIKGKKRKYFAMKEQEIIDSGTSTKPAPISPGGWWADLNNSTANKRSNLKQLMQGLAYAKADIELACKAIH